MKRLAEPFNGSIGHLRIDGPNFDGQLWKILGRKASADDYPEWRTVLRELRRIVGPCDGEIVYATGTAGARILPKLRALREQGLRTPVIAEATHGYDPTDPVDDYLEWQIDSAAKLGNLSPLVLCSHDHGYAKWLGKAMLAGVWVVLIGFCEEMAPELLALRDKGALILDLEYDLHAFDYRLPNRIDGAALAAMGIRPRTNGIRSTANREFCTGIKV